jgi:hypothetical protein
MKRTSFKINPISLAGCQWFMPVILATQGDHGSTPAWANCSRDPSQKIFPQKKGHVEWLKVKALSSNPSTKKKKIVNLGKLFKFLSLVSGVKWDNDKMSCSIVIRVKLMNCPMKILF